jgi:hypothetical protein
LLVQVASLSDAPLAHVKVTPSWFAYASGLVTGLLVLLAGEAAVWSASGLREASGGVIWSFLAAMATLMGVGGWLWYQLALVRSRVLSTDDSGVRYVQGVLPWAKAQIQVDWADLDAATCTHGFGSRMLNAYRIHVGHRITPDSEIVMFCVPQGPAVAAQINTLRQHYSRQPGARTERSAT